MTRRVLIRRIGGGLSGALLALALASGPADAASLPRLLAQDNSNTFQVRPATLSFGASGGEFITGSGTTAADLRAHHPHHIRWTTWTHNQAVGQGILWLDDCNPDCARGSYVPYSVSLNASGPKAGRFTRLVRAYRLQGRPQHDRLRLQRETGAWSWV